MTTDEERKTLDQFDPWWRRGWRVTRTTVLPAVFRFALANPLVSILLILVLVGFAWAWQSERSLRALEKQQFQAEVDRLHSRLETLQQFASQKGAEVEKLQKSRKQAKQQVSQIETEGVKRREAITSLRGREIEAAFRRRGY